MDCAVALGFACDLEQTDDWTKSGRGLTALQDLADCGYSRIARSVLECGQSSAAFDLEVCQFFKFPHAPIYLCPLDPGRACQPKPFAAKRSYDAAVNHRPTNMLVHGPLSRRQITDHAPYK